MYSLNHDLIFKQFLYLFYVFSWWLGERLLDPSIAMVGKLLWNYQTQVPLFQIIKYMFFASIRLNLLVLKQILTKLSKSPKSNDIYYYFYRRIIRHSLSDILFWVTVTSRKKRINFASKAQINIYHLILDKIIKFKSYHYFIISYLIFLSAFWITLAILLFILCSFFPFDLTIISKASFPSLTSPTSLVFSCFDCLFYREIFLFLP